MTVMFRSLLNALAILTLCLAVSACGVWRGASDVSTDHGGGAIGKGPGLITGKQGGIVIYQK
jgi:hypothetical protein